MDSNNPKNTRPLLPVSEFGSVEIITIDQSDAAHMIPHAGRCSHHYQMTRLLVSPLWLSSRPVGDIVVWDLGEISLKHFRTRIGGLAKSSL